MLHCRGWWHCCCSIEKEGWQWGLGNRRTKLGRKEQIVRKGGGGACFQFQPNAACEFLDGIWRYLQIVWSFCWDSRRLER